MESRWWTDGAGPGRVTGSARRVYHGANGDRLLEILDEGVIRPVEGKLYFGTAGPEQHFMHGGDRKRGASFVVAMDVLIPPHLRQEREHTHGVPNTLTVHTDTPLRAKIAELWVRRLEEGVGHLRSSSNPAEIKALLALP